jgi:hypothetical protein
MTSTKHSDLGTPPQTAQAEPILPIALVGLPPVLFSPNSLQARIKRKWSRQTDRDAIAADHQPT